MHVPLKQDPPDSKMEDSAQERRRGGSREGLLSEGDSNNKKRQNGSIYLSHAITSVYKNPME